MVENRRGRDGAGDPELELGLCRQRDGRALNEARVVRMGRRWDEMGPAGLLLGTQVKGAWWFWPAEPLTPGLVPAQWS